MTGRRTWHLSAALRLHGPVEIASRAYAAEAMHPLGAHISVRIDGALLTTIEDRPAYDAVVAALRHIETWGDAVFGPAPRPDDEATHAARRDTLRVEGAVRQPPGRTGGRQTIYGSSPTSGQLDRVIRTQVPASGSDPKWLRARHAALATQNYAAYLGLTEQPLQRTVRDLLADLMDLCDLLDDPTHSFASIAADADAHRRDLDTESRRRP